jgi:crotonobetainyl-CoA:carnitine CoA-transferase CaiB-like acyl-CoA transferase
VKELLKGMRILAIEQFGAGPFGTLHLADLGAEVIKIENPHSGGDISRSVPPFTGDQDSLYFQSFNRNKRSLTLDLKHPDGRKVFEELVAVSDAVFSSLRGDQPEALRLTYEHLKAVNPKIVCCALTGYGMTGPRKAEPAYDYLMQAYAGWMSLTGEPGSPPAKSAFSVVDFSAGLVAMTGMLSGILRARGTGIGCDVDVSLLDTAVSMLNYVAIWTLNRDYQPERLAASAHPSIVPSQVFETADGWIVVFCAKEKFWLDLATAMDAQHLIDDPRFQGFSGRLEHREALGDELALRFKTRTTDEWLESLRGKVPCAPVNDINQALEDEQVRARQMILEVEHPAFGPLKQTATAIKVSGGVDTSEDRRGPRLGEDSASILRGLLGYAESRVNELRRERVI